MVESQIYWTLSGCDPTAKLAETSALPAVQRVNNHQYIINGSSGPALIIKISGLLNNIFIISIFILMVGIWSGHLNYALDETLNNLAVPPEFADWKCGIIILYFFFRLKCENFVGMECILLTLYAICHYCTFNNLMIYSLYLALAHISLSYWNTIYFDIIKEKIYQFGEFAIYKAYLITFLFFFLFFLIVF